MKKRNATALSLILGLFLLGRPACAQEPSVQPKPEDPAKVKAVLAWLSTRAIPLTAVEAGNGFKDLEPLRKVLQGVRIVGLGEATHGSREVFQFKGRMLEFLVTRMGFNVFSIEASMPASMNINDYVVYGKGDPREALASQGFWTWNTEEVLAMMEWARQYNSKLPEARRVKFLGYDMQGGYNYAMDAVRAYLKKVAPDQVAEAEAAFAPLAGEARKPLPIESQTPEDQAKSVARIEALYGFLKNHRDEFVRQTPAWDFDVVLLHARVLVQGTMYFRDMGEMRKAAANPAALDKPSPKFIEAAKFRDTSMAENIGTEMKMLGPKAKMVVWAHNGHVGLGGYSRGDIASMGGHLRKMYGPAYYVLGFEFDHGAFQAINMASTGARGLQEFSIPPAKEGSMAWYLRQARAGQPLRNYVVDFRSAPKQGPVAEWFAAAHAFTSIGAGFGNDWTEDKYRYPVAPKDYFDGVIFIEETTRARPNPPLSKAKN